MSWNYRVARRRWPETDEQELAIYEAYYGDDGKIDGLTVRPVGPSGHDLDSLVADFERMRLALAEPIIDYDDQAAASDTEVL